MSVLLPSVLLLSFYTLLVASELGLYFIENNLLILFNVVQLKYEYTSPLGYKYH